MEEKVGDSWINHIDSNENYKESTEQLEKERQEDENAEGVVKYGSSEIGYFTLKDFEVQGTVYPDEPLREYFRCRHCEKRVPLSSFRGHIEETCRKLHSFQEEGVFFYGSTLDERTGTSEQSVESDSDVGDSESDGETTSSCFSIDGDSTSEGSVVSDETPSSKPKLRNGLRHYRGIVHPYYRPFLFGSPAREKYQILSEGRYIERVMLDQFLLQKRKYDLPSVKPELSQNGSEVERPDSVNETTAELPTASPHNCASPNSSSNSNSSYKSSVYYPHIHCGVKTSHQRCKYFMTSCPVHGGKHMVQVPERSFEDDSQKLKSALFKLQKIMEDEEKTKDKNFNIRIHCGVSTSEEEDQHKCMGFVLTCEHPVEKKAEVRKRNGINYVKFIQDFIQGLIDVEPSLDHLNSKHCSNDKIVNNHVSGTSEEIVHDTADRRDRTTCSPTGCFPTAGRDHRHHDPYRESSGVCSKQTGSDFSKCGSLRGGGVSHGIQATSQGIPSSCQPPVNQSTSSLSDLKKRSSQENHEMVPHFNNMSFSDFLLTASVPPDRQSSAKNSPEEPFDSDEDSNTSRTIDGQWSSYSCVSQVSKDGRYTLQRIEPDYSETKNDDPFWQEFERAIQKKLANHLHMISTSKS